MAVLRLTANNVTFVKRELRARYPDIRSAHLSEALAAALGYSTHASLKARLAIAALHTEDVVRLDTGQWQSRLESLCYNLSDTAPLVMSVRAPRLPDPCWVVVPKRNIDAVNEWFRYCQARTMPNVFLVPATKYARLEWDCISVEPRFENGVRGKAGDILVKQLLTTFQQLAKGHPGKPLFEGSCFVGTVERLLPETACDLADEFFIALYETTRASMRDAA